MCNKYSNVYIKLNYQLYDKIFADKQNKPKIRFFFDTQISDVDTLNALLKLGATDVYIVENLCFELDKISELVHSYNAAVRVYPNIAQSK